MRRLTRSRPCVCLPCQALTGRPYIALDLPRALYTSQRPSSLRPHKGSTGTKSTTRNVSVQAINDSKFAEGAEASFESGFVRSVEGTRNQKHDVQDDFSQPQRNHKEIPRNTRRQSGPPSIPIYRVTGSGPAPTSKARGTRSSPRIALNRAQQKKAETLAILGQRLTKGMAEVSAQQENATTHGEVLFKRVLSHARPADLTHTQSRYIDQLESKLGNEEFGSVKEAIDLAGSCQRDSIVTDRGKQQALARVNIIDQSTVSGRSDPSSGTSGIMPVRSPMQSENRDKGVPRRSLAGMIKNAQSETKKAPAKPTKTDLKHPPVVIQRPKTQSVNADDLVRAELQVDTDAELPELSSDLSRVLFSPGSVYPLQDPRSRVYNFPKHLEKIIPVSEFNFDALNPYLTSSEDRQLIDLAKSHGKRYIGSSSSMTSAMSHFHFLISQWRGLNMTNITRGFEETANGFTAITKSPAAIFLRYRDGVYAVDADKEYDEPNVLMSLGKALEKVLTLEETDFEKWRRKKSSEGEAQTVVSQPEAFHYSSQGQFLLRSQLDCQDKRLPGTGYFDLKTRAAVSIRMNLREHEAGTGYEIKERFGTWESYEREYFDMMRSTFLKYSLQARMGNMDGIFVAYHNVERMFGFQYIPITEMDWVLHGQTHPAVGDQEFKFSINFMEEIFETATKSFPKQSLRIHFESREPSVGDARQYMNIFIEPMAEDEIENMQKTSKARQDEYERRLLQDEEAEPPVDVEATLETEAREDVEHAGQASTDEIARPSGSEVSSGQDAIDAPLPTSTVIASPTGAASSAANQDFLNNILTQKSEKPKVHKGDVMGFTLSITNRINDRPTVRPKDIDDKAKWTIDYQLERMGDDLARKKYLHCKVRRAKVLASAINRGSDGYFMRAIRRMSEKGAEWRKQQDKLDAEREEVILYADRYKNIRDGE